MSFSQNLLKKLFWLWVIFWLCPFPFFYHLGYAMDSIILVILGVVERSEEPAYYALSMAMLMFSSMSEIILWGIMMSQPFVHQPEVSSIYAGPLFVVLVLGGGWFLLSKVVGPSSRGSREDVNQLSAYECGFPAFQSARRPFSIYFFFVAILFLIFDVELMLFLPVVLFFSLSFKLYVSIVLYVFILTVGLFHEWREGSLEWPSVSSGS